MNLPLTIYCFQTVSFLILVGNLRAIAKGKLGWVGVTEFVYGILGFLMVRFIIEAKTVLDMVAYAAGSTTGSLLGVWITRHWRD